MSPTTMSKRIKHMTRILPGILAMAAVVVAYLSVRLRSRLWALGLGLLMAGVLGNLTDRLLAGKQSAESMLQILGY